MQVYVSQLRKALGEGVIETRPGGYLAAGRGRRARPRSLREPARARARRCSLRVPPTRPARCLREALALWRGPALADCEHESFARDEIARLEELRLVALALRLEADLALGRHAEVVPELEALVREHPLRERLRELLILALYRAGRQADALAAYHDARATLVDELGLEPGAVAAASWRRRSSSRTPRSTWSRGAVVDGLPTGTVTFLFTDVEGSTEVLARLGSAEYAELLAEHRRLLREAFADAGGVEVDTQGDAFFVAFPTAAGAVYAAAQRPARRWPRPSCGPGSGSTPASRCSARPATSASTSRARRGSARPATAGRC